MRVVDEYVALRVLAGDWPAEIPHDVLGLTYARHWRLLSAIGARRELWLVVRDGGSRLSPPRLTTLRAGEGECRPPRFW